MKQSRSDAQANGDERPKVDLARLSGQVPAEIFGPVGSIIVQLALDTGATGTLIVIGYEPSLAVEQVKVTTGSAVESVPVLP